jgi:nicotinamide riboside transporter PnuC
MNMANSSSNRTLSICAWTIVVVATVVGVQSVVDALPRHGMDPTWPDHARFHVTLAALNQVGFCIMASAIALIPFRCGERWSWWVLLSAVLIFGILAVIPSAPIQGSGPQAHFYVPMAITYTAVIASLVLSWRVGFPGAGD